VNHKERGGAYALLDSLHDLEADPVMRGWLAESFTARPGGLTE